MAAFVPIGDISQVSLLNRSAKRRIASGQATRTKRKRFIIW